MFDWIESVALAITIQLGFRKVYSVQAKGIALSALIVGIVAFLIGWLPVVGILAGGAAIALGIIALIKGQSKALSITGLALGGLAAITSIVMTIAMAVIPAADIEAMQKSNDASEVADKLRNDAKDSVADAERKSAEEAARKKAAADEAAKTKADAAKAAEKKAAEKKADGDEVMLLVPDVAGLDGAKAKELLESLGFKVKFDGGGKAVIVKSNWQVVGTDPAFDSNAKFGSTITVKVKKKEAAPVVVERTSGGVEVVDAMVACERYAESQFIYGVKVHSILGVMAQRIENDQWFIKTEITPKNEFGTEMKGFVMECYVAGTEASPEVTSFYAY